MFSAVEGCTARQVWLLNRHGTRYPTKNDMGGLVAVLPRLSQQVAANHKQNRGTVLQMTDCMLPDAVSKLLLVAMTEGPPLFYSIPVYVPVFSLWSYPIRHQMAQHSHYSNLSYFSNIGNCIMRYCIDFPISSFLFIFIVILLIQVILCNVYH